MAVSILGSIIALNIGTNKLYRMFLLLEQVFLSVTGDHLSNIDRKLESLQDPDLQLSKDQSVFGGHCFFLHLFPNTKVK